MQIYLVGGAVRDKLLGLPVHERDYVVVGESPESMLAAGFQAIGKEFPVFLHPKTKEEYALARTERKVSKGYKGFEFFADPSVTLEQDLLRRDLTINAIAEDDAGHLHDPYDGQRDLQQKILRHVSPAFAEDPVRVLRIARFAAKLPTFSVDPKTNQLMHDMVVAGEVDALVAERVWKELVRALQQIAPWRFFAVLADCGALEKLFAGICTLDRLQSLYQQAQAVKAAPESYYALLWEPDAEASVRACNRRYKVPKTFAEFALLIQKHFYKWQALLAELNAESIMALLGALDAYRRPERFEQFLQTCALQANGKSQSLNDLLLRALKACQAIDNQALLAQGLKGPDFAKALQAERLRCIRELVS